MSPPDEPGAVREPGAGEVTLRYWAAARQAAGCESERVVGGRLGDILAGARRAHPDLTSLLAVAVVLVDGVAVLRQSGDLPEQLPVRPGATVEVLPPFSGG